VAQSLDIRSPDDLILSEITKTLKKKATNIADKRGVTLHWEIMQTNPSVVCNDDLKIALSKSILASGVDKIIEIPSGAGHDAVMISNAAPVAMLFVRCKAGISHNPLEYATPSDIKASLKVCHHFINEIISVENLKNN
jgi:allantoate deiminase